jgi:hypothetical protein
MRTLSLCLETVWTAGRGPIVRFGVWNWRVLMVANALESFVQAVGFVDDLKAVKVVGRRGRE